jgi:hypothetical protein
MQEDGTGLVSRLSTRLLDQMPELLEDVRVALSSSSPDYAAFLAAGRDDVVEAARFAISGLIAATQDRDHADPDGTGVLVAGSAELFEAIGEIHARSGDDLARLLTAYHTGARVAWRRLAAVALELDLPPRSVAELAEALFQFVDQLSMASVRGYLREQSELMTERGRQREELATMLLSDRCDSIALASAARRAGWQLPERASVILVPVGDETSSRHLARLEGLTLSTVRGDWIAIIWPDRPELASRRRKENLLRGARATIGRSVPIDQVPASLPVAITAAGLRGHGLPSDGLVFVDDHLDVIIVNSDPQSIQAFREQCLAPLDGAPPGTRERLLETLRSWLRHMGDRRAMAAELHIHPQTVRYRLAQLRALFGDRLDDPELRIQLTVALLPHAPDRPGGSATTAAEASG